MKSLKLNEFNRTKRYQNLELLADVRQKIKERIEAEFALELNELQEENKRFYKEEKKFREDAWKIVKEASKNNNLVRVRTQVGHQGSIIHDYTGRIQKLYSDSVGCFDIIVPTVYDGRPFTIGSSCLLSIEIIEPCEHDYDEDITMGHSIMACTKCGNVI